MKLTAVLSILLSFSSSMAFAQMESAASKEASAKFETYYNNNQFDSIFATFSASTKISLPPEKTNAFLSHLKNSFGHITRRTFEEYQGAFAVYKTEFDKGVLAISIAVDDNAAITGVYAKPYDTATQRNTTPMRLPFKGEWTVFWGGDTKELNYHVVAKFQKNAFDIVVNNPEGRSFHTNGKTNEDYYAFGRPILAPCDAEVVQAVEGVKDNTPGELNPLHVGGNAVLLRTGNGEYILLAHLKQYSVKVKQGDRVKRGQILGLCGNSGNSSEPHLHFHIQNIEPVSKATGVKCYFDKLVVNGVTKTDYSPVKGDHVKESE